MICFLLLQLQALVIKQTCQNKMSLDEKKAVGLFGDKSWCKVLV
jgi:hypothetical protein